jgi:ketosteroid isomerase-like protein
MPTPLQVQEAFRAVDEMRLDDFAALFAPDGSMTFGNGEPSVGPDACKTALGAFYQHLDGVRHELRGAWIFEDVSINEALVHYTMKDGSDVAVPVTSILHWSGDKVVEWRIYMDAAPAFAAIQAIAEARA